MRFELTFRTDMHGRKIGAYVHSGIIKRVIVVDDPETAVDVAKAMLGEEVNHSEHLKKLMSVKPTQDSPAIFVFDEGKYCWDRVLQNLKIHPDTIEYIWANVNGMRERVGFKRIAAQ